MVQRWSNRGYVSYPTVPLDDEGGRVSNRRCYSDTAEAVAGGTVRPMGKNVYTGNRQQRIDRWWRNLKGVALTVSCELAVRCRTRLYRLFHHRSYRSCPGITLTRNFMRFSCTQCVLRNEGCQLYWHLVDYEKATPLLHTECSPGKLSKLQYHR